MTPQRLSMEDKLGVQYCIPLWLRDEQVRFNTSRIKGRLQRSEDLIDDEIAIVCFGPSLKQTWERLKEFKFIMTCSGAHKFLIERGVVPTWHVEVDPREHKIGLLGEPHPNVTYLPASTCHPKYFAWLEQHGAKIKMWHVFMSEQEAYDVLPRGEWSITGGSSVGLRCLTLARFLGFTKLHVFGMDGCISEEGSHASAHPNAPPSHSIVEYDGKEYKVTPSILQCAKETWHELNMLKDVTAQFHGEGLVQAMSKSYVRKQIKEPTVIAINSPELISSEYRALNERLHQDNLGYGVGGVRHATTVIKLAQVLKTCSILDYGCGKGYLAKTLPFPIWEYDPSIPGKETPPRPADLVVCTDVLEHIEPDKLLFVLDDLRRCTLKMGYFVIHTGPASKVLADGRNAHLIQQPAETWIETIRKFFSVSDKSAITKPPMLYIIATPKLHAK